MYVIVCVCVLYACIDLCTVYSVQCIRGIVYGVQCKSPYMGVFEIVRRTMYSVQCTMYTVYCILYIVKCTLYNVQCTLYNNVIFT